MQTILFLLRRYLIILIVPVLVGLSACGPAAVQPVTPVPTGTPAPTAIPSPTPLPRGGDLIIRLATDIPNFQPWRPRNRGEEQLTGLLYNGLMRMNPQLRPEPDLARKWETTPDGRVITFTLRTDITWHDGEPFDAEDVRFTLDRLRTLPLTSTALIADLGYIVEVTAPATNTVVLSLSERYAPLLAGLTVPILPRHRLEAQDLETVNFWDMTPVGTGPFRFISRVPGQSIVLGRFDSYHYGAPLLDRVAFVGAADSDLTLSSLQDERLLLAELPWNATRNLTSTIQNIRVGTYPENGFYFLAFNLREGRAFANPEVRKALAAALDLPRLVEAATDGQGIPIASSAAPGSWADLTPLTDDRLQANLELARALLTEAGWELPPGSTIRQQNGVPFEAQLLVRNDDARRIAAAQYLAEVAARIGLQVTVVPTDFETILSKYAPPYDFDLLVGSWINGAGDPNFADYAYYDPDDFTLFHSSQINQGIEDTRITRNFVGFSDPVYDEQSVRGRQLYTIDERIDAYRQTQTRVFEQLPYLYLWADRIPVVLNQRVKTLDGPIDLSTPVYLWNIERWYLDTP